MSGGATATEASFADRELHFIAIGGAGMSALALACHALGARVSGSDRSESGYVARLRAAGIDPLIGHDADAVPPGADVVVSTAGPDDNVELLRARERGQREIHRGALLAELCATKRLIAIAGAHGKTTTSGMLAHCLSRAGAEPAFLLGGELPGAAPEGARQRGLGGGGVDRRRGGRERRQLPRARAGGRRGDPATSSSTTTRTGAASAS